ncbi:hypothetical protein J2Z58_001391 [Halobacillus andaensis]|nr:hypothetical protein [Halobacillus andaensis]
MCFRKLFSRRQARRPLPFPRTRARASSRKPCSAISAHSFFRRSGRGLAPWNFFKTEKDSPSPSSPLLSGRNSFSRHLCLSLGYILTERLTFDVIKIIRTDFNRIVRMIFALFGFVPSLFYLHFFIFCNPFFR